MTSKSILIALVAIMVFGMVGFLFSLTRSGTEKPPPPASTEPPPGDQIVGKTETLPEFSFKDYDNRAVRSFDFRDLPLVVSSWASWCDMCMNGITTLAAAQRTYEGYVAVVAINRAESRAAAKRATDTLGVSEKLVLLLDPSDSFYASMHATTMPETLFISKDGRIVDRIRGPISREALDQKIQALLH